MTTLKFDVEGFDGGIESRRVGDHIEIAYQGMPVMAFAVGDLTARDWTIASLRETGLKGKTVAGLCHTSPAQVSMVWKLVRQAGHEALVHGRPGRRKKLTGSCLWRAMELRRQGSSVRDIGKELGVSPSTAARAVQSIPLGEGKQQEVLAGVGAPPSMDDAPTSDEPSCERPSREAAESSDVAESTVTGQVVEPDSLADEVEQSTSPGEDGPRELLPAWPLPAGPAEHPCRYAGTLLVCAAVQMLGLFDALRTAWVRRPNKSLYDAQQAIVGLVSAWAAGFVSVEAMHERDARALGVVLGLERSLSVRTLHRAIGQMVERFDPIALGAALLQGLIAAVGKVPRVFGIDGHFKPYYGKELVDKGWDTKRRLAHRGIADVLVHDEQGRIWVGVEVGASESLHEHVVSAAERLRGELGDEESVVMAFDRGGFSFEVLNALDRNGFGYVAWVPATVSMPDLSSIAPPCDGVGEQRWAHSKLTSEHRARLLVQRDGETLVPAVTNLPEDVAADEALGMLRRVRGWQENDIKAARAFAHIDRLVDRGGARRARDDRQVDNPVYREMSAKRREVRERLAELERRWPVTKHERAVHDGAVLMAELEEALLSHRLHEVPAKVPRLELEPDAQRAWLKTRNRSLVQPLKYVLANARRWLLSALGAALAPSDADCDATAVGRTLEALIRAPGTVRFGRRQVVVTLELPLPPQPHERLARGLDALAEMGLRFSDGRRFVVFRLAPRPTRDALPSAASCRSDQGQDSK